MTEITDIGATETTLITFGTPLSTQMTNIQLGLVSTTLAASVITILINPTRFVQAENDYQKFLSTFSLQANALRMRARAVSGERMRCRDAFWRKCGSNDAGESKDQNYDNITQFAEKDLGMDQDQFTNAMLIAFNNDMVKKSLVELVSQALTDPVLDNEVVMLRAELRERDQRIHQLEEKLQSAVLDTDSLEQYTTEKVMELVNSTLKLDPPHI
ncbi:hypothetical protein CAPTEDRAFT_212480 [Capitella teleta]|uniref:Uncharacterized protein n=1 Tax=Capitella teleta TaxID=283909 RepID=R7TJL8_CAPTE|nr:hypothetical protein CAPTEDRAFT_212480 [Capitella teleta]|eukprot:ELT91736.1 hypothetical protein CAPTEDRAFT_212480 [Capitella teleta]